MKLSFLGGAGTVTGSKYLIQSGHSRLLIDCGLFQGLKALRERNWSEPPFEPKSIDAVVLTHAHLDHSGYLPVLFQRGFRGVAHCTRGTQSLCEVLLPDSGHLQEEAAKYAQKKGFSKHSPARPLYTEEEARESLKHFHTHPFGKSFRPTKGLTCSFSRAGHILGSACVTVSDGTTTVGFSGDVGRPGNPVLMPPETMPPVDYLVVESTYGNRVHPQVDPGTQLAEIVNRTCEKGGVLLIPSFAVGRSQMILHLLGELRAAGEIPSLPVYMDSPMAIKATSIYCGDSSESRLNETEAHAMCHTAIPLRTPQESISLNSMEGPMIILSASGMATGGRVLHHLKRLLPDERNTVLFAGFQAAGTRGETLVSGAGEVRIHGAYVPVYADVFMLESLSAHGDRTEMLDWLEQMEQAPRKTFVTHGEPSASDAFRRYLRTNLGWDAEVPEHGQTVELT